jgi:hypothetical protein
MKHTYLASNPAHVAGATRPCAFSAGYAWRVDSVSSPVTKQARIMTAPARRLQEIPT